MEVAEGRGVRPTDRTVALLVVSGIRLYRESLAETLSRLPDVERVETADSGAAGLNAVRRLNTDLVLADMSLPEAALVVQGMIRAVPRLRVVALGVAETEADVMTCIETGICGYVSRDASLAELCSVLEHAMRGEAVCPPHITAGLIRRIAVLSEAVRAPSAGQAALDRLTVREREVVHLLGLGMSNRQIANKLGIAICTAKNHVHNVLEKLGVTRRADAVRLVRQESS